MSNLVNSIEGTLRERLLDAMPDDPNGRFAAKALADLIVDYGTWLSHGVPARPRCLPYLKGDAGQPKGSRA